MVASLRAVWAGCLSVMTAMMTAMIKSAGMFMITLSLAVWQAPPEGGLGGNVSEGHAGQWLNEVCGVWGECRG